MKQVELIEQMRSRMIKLVGERGSFVDEDVVKMSQQLDKLLVRYQKLKQCDNFHANEGVVA